MEYIVLLVRAYMPQREAHSLVRGCAHADDVTRRTLPVLAAMDALVYVCEEGVRGAGGEEEKGKGERERRGGGQK